MLINKTKGLLLLTLLGLVVILFSACSTKKNTTMTRFYHSLNTRYNIYFNAENAYNEALIQKRNGEADNFSELLYIYPDHSDTTEYHSSQGAFSATIEKCTKAIKLHSIKAQPRRNPARRNDKRYQDWLKQQEFNPFLENVWLLLGKAEFQDGNYLRAIGTFMYTAKIYSPNADIVAECRLWIAKAYTEMGWMHEAGDVLYKLEVLGKIPESQRGLYASVKANYLMRNNDFAASVPYLQTAIDKEKDKLQRTRMKYLLGQIYQQLGENQKAYQAFAKVNGLGTNQIYSFNAQLRKIGLSDNPRQAIEDLSKMASKSQNKKFQDQIYYTIGNLYLAQLDTVQAIKNFKKGIELSTRNGIEKAICQIALADIYFQQREFISAQPYYSGALSQIKKSYSYYPRVALRSSVLDELVVYAKIVYEQDSLQKLVRMPEDDRMKVINNKITRLKWEEENKKRIADQEARMEERNQRVESWNDLEKASLLPQNNMNTPQSLLNQMNGQGGNDAIFYFYNEQTVSQGKLAFQRNWGNRKLEDNWRRNNKYTNSFDDNQSESDNDNLQAQNDSVGQPVGRSTPNTPVMSTTTDIYSPEFYLAQLPFMAEAIKKSDALIEDALFNMGMIYKYKLEDLPLAIDVFTTNIKRYPQSPNLEEMYYQLFLIYLQQGNQNMMAFYRAKLLSEFTKGTYAVALSEPDYEWNFRHMATLQDSLYDATYEAYMRSDVKTVRANYESISTKYPLSDLMPKFALLNALTYAQTRDAIKLRDKLKEIVEKYPKSDVAPLATDILERIKDGQILLSDGSPMRGINWGDAFVTEGMKKEEQKNLLDYTPQLDTPYILLLRFAANTVDRNELLYQVADYNFSNYVVQTFDLSFQDRSSIQTLQVKGFDNFGAIQSYLERAFEDGNLISKLDTSILVIPISADNYDRVYPRLGLDRYMQFFADSLGAELPQLVQYWKQTESRVESQAISDKKKIEGKAEKVPQKSAVINQQPIEEKTKEKPIEIPVKQPSRQDLDVEKQNEQPKEEDRNGGEITADDLLTKEQLEAAGKVNDVLKSGEEILNNPVDGIKNLFKKYQNRQSLTKEEKAELKAQDKLEKQQRKEQQAIQKAKQDSIMKLEKANQAMIDRAQKATQDSINAAEKQRLENIKLQRERKEQQAKDTQKAKEDARKQREAERKEKERAQKERLRQREAERREKEKAREQERKEKEKLANERRKKQSR